MGDIKLTLEADQTDLLRAMQEHDRVVQQVEKNYKDVTKAAQQAGKQGEESFKKTKSSADSAAGSVGKTKKEMTGFQAAAANATKQAEAWVKGFAGVGGVVAAIKGLVDNLKEAQSLQKSMLGVAVNVDQLAKDLAGVMKGGMTPENIKKARDDIANLSYQTSTDVQTAYNALFYAKSSFGDTPAGRTAAITSAKIAATYGQDAEKQNSLISLFKAAGADTEEAQIAVSTKLMAATKSSIADAAAYTPEFVKSMPILQAAGFSDEESMALMNSAIVGMAGNVPEGGTRLRSAVRYAMGPTGKAGDFMSGYARQSGMNWNKLTPAQRAELTREAYQQAIREGTINQFGAAWGGEAMVAFSGVFTEQAEAEYNRSLGEIRTADPNMIRREYDVYTKTLPAVQQKIDTQMMLSQAKTGREKAAVSLFNDLAKDALDRARASAEGAENIPFVIEKSLSAIPLIGGVPGAIMKRGADKALVDALLEGAYEHRIDMRERGEIQGPDPVFQRIQEMRRHKGPYTEEFIGELYEVSEGFTTYSDRSKAAAESRAATDAVRENTKVMQDLSATLNRLADQAGTVGAGLRPD